MTSGNDQINSVSYINYLSRILEIRLSELRAANRSLALQSRQNQSHNQPLNYCIQCYRTEYSDGSSVQAVTDLACLRLQVEDLSNTVTCKNVELTELRLQLRDIDCKFKDSLTSIALLKAQAQQDDIIRKAKEDDIEELLMLHQSESDSVAELKCANVDLSKRLDACEKLSEDLRLELETLRRSAETKEESIAQVLFEKDDLEETNASYKYSNSVLSQEISKLEAFLHKEIEEKQKILDEKKILEIEKVQFLQQMQVLEGELTHLRQGTAALEVEKAKYLEQIEVLGGQLALCQQADAMPMCSQLTDVTNSQQLSQLTMMKFELTAVQAEKEDLEQQLELYKVEFARARINCTCQQDNTRSSGDLLKRITDLNAENEQLQESLSEKSNELHKRTSELQKYKSQLGAQDNQNTELIGQLLLLEDRLAESDVLLRESRESAERLASKAVEATDSSVQLQEQVSCLSSRLETADNKLQCCVAELDLLKCKYKTVSERYQHLLTSKNQLDQTCQLLVEKVTTLQNKKSVSETCLLCVDHDLLRQDFEQLQNSCCKLTEELRRTQVQCRQLKKEKETTIMQEMVSHKLNQNLTSHTNQKSTSSPVLCLHSEENLAQTKLGKDPIVESAIESQDTVTEMESYLIDELREDFETVHQVENSCKRRVTPTGTVSKSQLESGKRQLFNDLSVGVYIPFFLVLFAMTLQDGAAGVYLHIVFVIQSVCLCPSISLQIDKMSGEKHIFSV